MVHARCCAKDVLVLTVSRKPYITQAVLSQLSVIPGSPLLHNKMFGRSAESTTGSDENSTNQTLLDNLVNIWAEAQERVATIPEAVDKLTWVRKTMGVHDVATVVGSQVIVWCTRFILVANQFRYVLFI